MEITRFNEANPYSAPDHFNMTALRLQGHEASGASSCWVGLSTFRPGGGAEKGATPFEKIYVVVEGEVIVTIDSGKYTLGPYDSCRIEPNEERSILNESDSQAKVLIVIPYS